VLVVDTNRYYGQTGQWALWWILTDIMDRLDNGPCGGY
jgi:hypothetical protein